MLSGSQIILIIVSQNLKKLMKMLIMSMLITIMKSKKKENPKCQKSKESQDPKVIDVKSVQESFQIPAIWTGKNTAE